MRHKSIALVIVITMIFTLLAIGCTTPQKKPAPQTKPTPQTTPAPNNNMTTQDKGKTAESKKIATMIVDKNKSIKSATVVLANTTAYVGIDLAAEATGNKAETVKTEVARIVKEQDTSIKTVYVTEDVDTVTRLKNIARDIENGKPLSGFINELENAFKRITPSMK